MKRVKKGEKDASPEAKRGEGQALLPIVGCTVGCEVELGIWPLKSELSTKRSS